MSKKHKPDTFGLVYSTEPNFKFEHEAEPERETLSADKQKLIIKLDNKHRAGKTVTLVAGFKGTLNDTEEFCKNLKSLCGTGGSVKHEGIIIQGNNCDKILKWLHQNGYVLSKKGT